MEKRTGKQLIEVASGTLFDLGDGMIFDSLRKIIWLKDANYASTSGYVDEYGENNGGKMTWREAEAWVNQLEYGGFSDWRLPKISDPNIAYIYGYDGTTSGGYNVRTDEMGYMYYVLLEKLGEIALDGTNPQAGFSRIGNHYDKFPFVNIQNDEYWYGTSYSINDEISKDIPNGAWSFEFGTGHQGIHGKGGKLFVWPVRDVLEGDILIPSPLPPPSISSISQG